MCRLLEIVQKALRLSILLGTEQLDGVSSRAPRRVELIHPAFGGYSRYDSNRGYCNDCKA